MMNKTGEVKFDIRKARIEVSESDLRKATEVYVQICTTSEVLNQQILNLRNLHHYFEFDKHEFKRKINAFLKHLDKQFDKKLESFYSLENIMTLNILESKEFVLNELSNSVLKSVSDLKDDEIIKLKACIDYYKNNKESFKYVELDSFGERQKYTQQETRMLLYAFRYALNHNTNASLDVISQIIDHWEILNDVAKEKIVTEIKEASFKSDIAKQNWSKILELK